MGVNRDDLQQIEEGDTDLVLLAALLGASLTRRTRNLQSFTGKQAALTRIANQRATMLRQLASRFANKEITLVQFEALGAEIWASAHTQAAEIWVGGGRDLTQGQTSTLARALEREAGFWRRMIADLRSGTIKPSSIIGRSGMYGHGARATYYQIAQESAGQANAVSERNVLSPGDNCESSSRPGCIEVTAMGIVPLGELPPIGSRTCLTNDRCRIEYLFDDREPLTI